MLDERGRPPQIAELLAAAAADRLAALWLLVIAWGLRRGDALALRWDDIDLERGHLQVRATLHLAGGQPVREPMPKTKSSRRALPLPALVVDALKAHRSNQAAERMAARVWADPTLVFTTRVGTAIEPRNSLRALHTLCDRAGVRRARMDDLLREVSSPRTP